MDFWLLNQYILKRRRSPSFTGTEIYMIIVGSIIVLAIFFLVASGLESRLAEYIADKKFLPFAVVLCYALLDLFIRSIISPSTFAEQTYYLLPIPRLSYAIQTVMLSFYNIINLAAALFLFIYLIFTSIAPELEVNLILWFFFIILGNNALALTIKRWRFTALVLLGIALAVIFFSAQIQHYLIRLIYAPELGLIYFLFLSLVAGVVVYFTYPKEKKIAAKSTSSLLRFNIRLNDPLVWQEVLLIVRNKRPRGLLLSYFILIPYFFFIFNDRLQTPDPSSFAVIFVVLFLVAGLPIQYGYLGLAWENQHLEKLLSVTNIKNMIEAKYKLLSYLNVAGMICVLIICFWMPVLLPVVLASWTLQQTWGNYMLLYYMIYNKKPFEINKSSFFNYDGISAAQMFLPLIILVVQILVLMLLVSFFGSIYGSLFTIGLGVVGFYLKPKLLTFIEIKWQENKYVIVQNFKNS